MVQDRDQMIKLLRKTEMQMMIQASKYYRDGQTVHQIVISNRTRVEIALQDYYFPFLSLQVFLVVSITSSVATVLSSLRCDFTLAATLHIGCEQAISLGLVSCSFGGSTLRVSHDNTSIK